MRWVWILLAFSAIAQTTQTTPTPKPAEATPTPPPAPVPPPAAKPPPHAATAPVPGDLMRASIDKQRAAIRKQAQSLGAWIPPWSADMQVEEALTPPCEPIADEVVAPLIDGAAKAQDVEAHLLRAVIEQESAFRPCAISVKGAQGLMQLMPDTAEQLAVKDVFDPKENIEAGAKYLKQLLDKYKGDLKLALGAYNSGPTTVDQAGGIPDIPETRDYVDSILKKLAK